MGDIPFRKARINSQLLSYTQNLETVKTNLFNCNSVEQRDYINRRGEHQLFLEFNFPNGKKTLSIHPTEDVKELLNHFLNNTGIFNNQESPLALTSRESK